MPRVNIERQKTLEPRRYNYATSKIEKLGYEITNKTATSFQFAFKDSVITFFPYSGWAAGKTITDGRGIENLLKQIQP